MEVSETMPTRDLTKTSKKGISGSTLKIIAIVSMLFDHIAVVILERALIQRGILEALDFNLFLEANAKLYYTYFIFRMIGRIALPIFCFLLVQGFLHTHHLKKYLGMLFLFALISELPFDLALFGNFFDWSYQNIFFTLFFGALALTGIRTAEEKKEWHIIWRVLFCLLVIGLSISVVILLKTDYDLFGVLAIVMFYLFRQKKMLSAAIACTVLLMSSGSFSLMGLPVFIALIPIYLYNGERGINVKWIFYLFYPVHLFLLYLISYAMGLGQIPL